MKPWQTKQWQEMRKQKIGNKCQQCGSTKPPFVLQHLSHAPSYYAVKSKKTADMFSVWRKENNIEIPYVVKAYEACPNCEGPKKDTYYRKKTRDYRCSRCGHVFEKRIISRGRFGERIPDEQKVHEIFEQFKKEKRGEIEKEALEQAEKNFVRYMSGEGTVTFCSKCAYLWDMKGEKLCQRCRKHYHSFQYNTCYKCSMEEKQITLKIKQNEIDEAAKSGEKKNLLLCSRCKQHYYDEGESVGCLRCEKEIEEEMETKEAEERLLFDEGTSTKYVNEKRFTLEWHDDGGGYIVDVPESLVEQWINMKGKPNTIREIDVKEKWIKRIKGF